MSQENLKNATAVMADSKSMPNVLEKWRWRRCLTVIKTNFPQNLLLPLKYDEVAVQVLEISY
jgi:hypothetical protein